MRNLAIVFVMICVFLSGCTVVAEERPPQMVASVNSYTADSGNCLSDCEHACLNALKDYGMECDFFAKSACAEPVGNCITSCQEKISIDDCSIYCRTGSQKTCRRNMAFTCFGGMKESVEYRSCYISCRVGNC